MKPTSRPSSKSALEQTLSQLLKRLPNPNPRIGILGIGQELRGDDAAGVMIVRALLPLATGHASVLVLDGGPAPENFTGPLRRFAPDLVLLPDAALMDAEPGEMRLIDWRDTMGLSASTHTLPPYMLASYLAHEIGCEVVLLGIQPAANELDTPLSPPVAQAVQEAVEVLSELFIFSR